MRITQEKAYRNTFVAEYEGIDDLGRTLKNAPAHLRDRFISPNGHEVNWAGGSTDDVIRKCESGDMRYVKRSEKLVDRISNVAIEGTSIQLEYNPVYGMLDQAAMDAGNPMCMYGATMTTDDRSPVMVYVDNWISSTIPNDRIVRRGVAVLALVQALSVYRPVFAKFVAASGATFDRHNDNIQIIPVPTYPMDLSRAAWMLASPEFTRAGVYSLSNLVHDQVGMDFGPIMAGGRGKVWQKTQLGKWAAARDGVTDHVFLPMMMDKRDTSDWKNDETALKWVQKHVKRLRPT